MIMVQFLVLDITNAVFFCDIQAHYHLFQNLIVFYLLNLPFAVFLESFVPCPWVRGLPEFLILDLICPYTHPLHVSITVLSHTNTHPHRSCSTNTHSSVGRVSRSHALYCAVTVETAGLRHSVFVLWAEPFKRRLKIEGRITALAASSTAHWLWPGGCKVSHSHTGSFTHSARSRWAAGSSLYHLCPCW